MSANTAGPRFARQRIVRFSDCDPAGIVFFPQYFVMFNALIEDWFNEELDISYRTYILEQRCGLPTVHLEADFRAVTRMSDVVTLSLAVEQLGSKSITLDLRCEGDDGELRMSLRQVIVTTSLDTHQSIEIPAHLRAAIQRTSGNP